MVIIFSAGDCKKSSEEEPENGTVYYLVSEINLNHMDSYILPLRDPDDIADADDIVNGISRNRIVVAKIDYGNGDGIYLNKDLAGSGNIIWSWHVTEFEGFADVTIEILDGNPAIVENDIEKWMGITGGVIGFWNYTVTRRVDISEIKK